MSMARVGATLRETRRGLSLGTWPGAWRLRPGSPLTLQRCEPCRARSIKRCAPLRSRDACRSAPWQASSVGCPAVLALHRRFDPHTHVWDARSMSATAWIVGCELPGSVLGPGGTDAVAGEFTHTSHPWSGGNTASPRLVSQPVLLPTAHRPLATTPRPLSSLLRWSPWPTPVSATPS